MRKGRTAEWVRRGRELWTGFALSNSGTQVRWFWSPLGYVWRTPEEESEEETWKRVACMRGRSVCRRWASRCVWAPACRRTPAPAQRSPLSPSRPWQHPFLLCLCPVLQTPPALPAPCPRCWRPPSPLHLLHPLRLRRQQRRSCRPLGARVGVDRRLRGRVQQKSSLSPHSAHSSLAFLTAANWSVLAKSWGRLQNLTPTAEEWAHPWTRCLPPWREAASIWGRSTSAPCRLPRVTMTPTASWLRFARGSNWGAFPVKREKTRENSRPPLTPWPGASTRRCAASKRPRQSLTQMMMGWPAMTGKARIQGSTDNTHTHTNTDDCTLWHHTHCTVLQTHRITYSYSLI